MGLGAEGGQRTPVRSPFRSGLPFMFVRGTSLPFERHINAYCTAFGLPSRGLQRRNCNYRIVFRGNPIFYQSRGAGGSGADRGGGLQMLRGGASGRAAL